MSDLTISLPLTSLKACVSCGILVPLGRFHKRFRKSRGKIEYDAKCQKCENQRIKEWRNRNGYWWNQKLSDKTRARHAVNDAIKARKLVKPPTCSQCAQPTISSELHAHHADHSEPFGIEWLCRSCHQKRHRPATQCGTVAAGSDSTKGTR